MIGACTRTFLLRPSLNEASALPLTPQAGRGGPKRRDTRPSPRLRGEGAGRRMRGALSANVATVAPPFPLIASLRSALLSDEERAAGLMPAGRPEA